MKSGFWKFPYIIAAVFVAHVIASYVSVVITMASAISNTTPEGEVIGGCVISVLAPVTFPLEVRDMLHQPKVYGMSTIFVCFGSYAGFFALMLYTAHRRWLAGKRHPYFSCRSCGYNLRGNISGICPECGTATR